MRVEGFEGVSSMRVLYATAVVALLLVLVAELQMSVRHLSQTFDESAHLYAGYQHWRAHDFGVNPEHPPLVKLVAAAPLLGMRLNQPHPSNPFFIAEEYMGGSQLLYGNDPDALLLRARSAVSWFTVLLALLVFCAGFEMFGPLAGLLGLALLTFEPTLLAHGALVTTDMGVTTFLFAGVYAFYRYVKKPGVGRLLLFAAAVGLALVSKLSGVLVLPVVTVCAVVDLAGAWNPKRTMRLAGAIVFAAIVGYGIVWAFYGFRYAARPAGLVMAPLLSQFVLGLPKSWEMWVVLHLAHWHLLPEAYLYGWTKLPIDQKAHPMFLLGKVYATGRWFYFPVALLIKSSLTLLLLLAVAPVMYVQELRAYRREMTFLAVGLVVLLLSVMTSHLDIGVRHALPLYPFAVVLGGASAWALTKTWRVGGYAVAALMLFQVVSSLRTFPDYLAYANEGFGGPNRSYRVLADSNVDWGQQLKEVSDYVRNNHVQECWFAYSLDTTVSPERYGIPCKQLPSGFGFWIGMPQPIVPTPITGVVLVGASDASGVMWGGGDMNPYRQFQDGQPERLIGSTVLVYQGSYDIPLATAQAHFSQVGALLRQHKTAEALAEARQAVALAPEAAEVQVELGGTLKALHQDAKAAEAFEEAMKLAKAHRPDDQSTQVAALIAAAGAPQR